MGSLLRTTRLTTAIEASLGGSISPLDTIAVDSLVDAICGLDVVIVDGPLPNPDGLVTRFESSTAPFSELHWLSICLVAVSCEVPLVMHDIDISDQFPPWVEPMVATVFESASVVIVTSPESERRLREQLPEVEPLVFPHPLDGVEAPSPPGDAATGYWLLDSALDGQDHGVTIKVVERCAAESDIAIVRVKRSVPHGDEESETADVYLPSLNYKEAVDLLARSAAVPLAGHDLAAAARSIGIPSFPGIEDDADHEDANDLLPDQLLMAALSHPVASRSANDTDELEAAWEGVRAELESPSPSSAALRHLMAQSPHASAVLARDLRGAHLEATARRLDGREARKREQKLEEAYKTERRERGLVARQLERAQKAGATAKENLADQRRQLRRSAQRHEDLSSTIRELRAELQTQAQAIDRLEKEVTTKSERLDRSKASLTNAEEKLVASVEQYERLRSRKAVRLALGVANVRDRLPWRR